MPKGHRKKLSLVKEFSIAPTGQQLTMACIAKKSFINFQVFFITIQTNIFALNASKPCKKLNA
jgi:hypothetical protein